MNLKLVCNMKKFFLFIATILLLSSCSGPCAECSKKYKVTVKSCDGNTIEEYYPDLARVCDGTTVIVMNGKKKRITGGIVIIEQL